MASIDLDIRPRPLNPLLDGPSLMLIASGLPALETSQLHAIGPIIITP